MDVVYDLVNTAHIDAFKKWDTTPWTDLYLANGLAEMDVCRALQRRFYALAHAAPGVGCYVCMECNAM